MFAVYADIQDAVARLCEGFPGPYWRDLDRRRAYPSEFVEALASVLAGRELAYRHASAAALDRELSLDHRLADALAP